eukprot:94252-Amorphochlora_amoeboformis.AAC.1
MDSTIGLCRRRRRWDPAAWSTLSILGLLAISLTDITSGLPGILRASSDETSESVQSAVESGARWSIFDKTNAVALAHQQRNEVRRQAYIRSLIGRLDYLKGEGEDFYNVKLAKTQRRRNSIEKEFTKQELEEVLEDIDDVQFSSQPRGIGNGTLKDYQIDFINWMSRWETLLTPSDYHFSRVHCSILPAFTVCPLYNRGVSGILADEMGLGKTVQAVSIPHMEYLTTDRVNSLKFPTLGDDGKLSAGIPRYIGLSPCCGSEIYHVQLGARVSYLGTEKSTVNHNGE